MSDVILRGDDGTFLVRTSDSDPTQFSITFKDKGKIHHGRIYCRAGRYFITEEVCTF